MYKIFLESHSGFRYIVFVLLLVSIITAIKGWLSASEYTATHRKLNLFAMVSAHIQLLLGIVLYFQSPFVQFDKGGMKDAMIRYWTTEHSVMMIIAIAVITIGHSRSKRAGTATAKHSSIAIFYGMALLIIIETIVISQRPFFGMTH